MFCQVSHQHTQPQIPTLKNSKVNYILKYTKRKPPRKIWFSLEAILVSLHRCDLLGSLIRECNPLGGLTHKAWHVRRLVQ